MCLYSTATNTHSDDPEEWIDSERLSAILTDVAYAIVYSRSHMIPKNGKTARPKMHVYLPAGICKDATMHKKMKTPHSERNAVLRQQRS